MSELERWEADNLAGGRYMGPDLAGFGWAPCDYIPKDARMEAMKDHQQAERS